MFDELEQVFIEKNGFCSIFKKNTDCVMPVSRSNHLCHFHLASIPSSRIMRYRGDGT
jgi:hypothetical protein